MGLLEEVAERKRALDAARPLNRTVVEGLADLYEVELTLSRLALEGRRLSRDEVRSLFAEARPILSGSVPSDRRFALNHLRMLELSARLTSRGGAVSDRTAAAFHGALTRGVDPAAGRPRQDDLKDDWGAPAPDAAKVAVALSAFNTWSRRAENGVEAAIEALCRLAATRPFTSANATVALAVADLILARAGYPPILVPEGEVSAFRDAIRRLSTTGDRGPTRDLVSTILRRELERCLVAAAEAVVTASAPRPRQKS